MSIDKVGDEKKECKIALGIINDMANKLGYELAASRAHEIYIKIKLSSHQPTDLLENINLYCVVCIIIGAKLENKSIDLDDIVKKLLIDEGLLRRSLKIVTDLILNKCNNYGDSYIDEWAPKLGLSSEIIKIAKAKLLVLRGVDALQGKRITTLAASAIFLADEQMMCSNIAKVSDLDYSTIKNTVKQIKNSNITF